HFGKKLFGRLMTSATIFNSTNLRPQQIQDRSLVAGSSPDFKYLITRLDLQQFRLESYWIGLGYGLSLTNRKGLVFIGMGQEGAVKKEMPGKSIHGLKNRSVLDTFFLKHLHQCLSLSLMYIVVL